MAYMFLDCLLGIHICERVKNPKFATHILKHEDGKEPYKKRL